MQRRRFLATIRRHFKANPVRTTLIGVLGLLIVLGIAGLLYFAVIAAQLPSEGEISNIRIPDSTKIYDRTGQVLLYDLAQDQKRTVVPLSDIPDSLKQATIDIEDQRFYTEPGIDLKGIIRAVFVDLTSGSLAQGGSTITQQLARNTFLSPNRTLTRKIKETLLAVKINHYYSKDKVLELYLNQIPYGPTIYGVETASEDYFGKPVNELTLGESAVLASLPKAPSRYSPWGSHVDELMARQRLVLQKMYENGHITKDQLTAAENEQITFQQQYRGMKAPHFVVMVEEYLAQKYGEDVLQKGNLKITTTLDWDLQQAAEKAVSEGAARNAQLYDGKNAALVAEDPKTGQVLALVGSHDYFDIQGQGNFNVATQGLRQPGSALKPFVYMSAFEKGYTPNTILYDVPTEFVSGDPNCPTTPNYSAAEGTCFHPQNFNDTFLGPVPMKIGLAQSMNVVSVKTLYLTGLNDAVTLANQLGIATLTDPSRYGLSLVLGGGEVRLIDMVKAYGVLAQDGVQHPQAIVLEVKDADGKTLESFQDQPQAVIQPQYPQLINGILKDANLRAGLFQSSLNLTVFPGHEVALKTGTTNDYRDAWAFGYTPSLVAGVWAGNNNNQAMQRHGSSILAAVPIWSQFMNAALQHYPSEAFASAEIPVTGKAVLDGATSVNGEVHDILYYVDRANPTGPPPANPSADSQFANWEYAVTQWASTNAILNSGGDTTSTNPFGTSTDATTTVNGGNGTDVQFDGNGNPTTNGQ
jgi:1A family penicillin-binding protein